VDVERVGRSEIDGSRASKVDIGYIPYVAVVESRIRNDRRGFVRAK
jgi:hypothetical protein